MSFLSFPPSSSASGLVQHQDGDSGCVVMGDGSLHLPPMSLAQIMLPTLPFSILTTLAPFSIHKPEMISVLLFVSARIRQCQTALQNIIHLVGHQSGTQKMKCCTSSLFEKRVSLCRDGARPETLLFLFTVKLLTYKFLLAVPHGRKILNATVWSINFHIRQKINIFIHRRELFLFNQEKRLADMKSLIENNTSGTQSNIFDKFWRDALAIKGLWNIK